MKRKDLGLILVIIIISAVISLFVSKAIFTSPKSRQQQVDVVQPITADFPKPDSHYFNSSAFDPTQLITIGQNANPDPFSGSGIPQ
jgi:ABC-type anion transport system duplicated permease subunit